MAMSILECSFGYAAHYPQINDCDRRMMLGEIGVNGATNVGQFHDCHDGCALVHSIGKFLGFFDDFGSLAKLSFGDGPLMVPRFHQNSGPPRPILPMVRHLALSLAGGGVSGCRPFPSKSAGFPPPKNRYAVTAPAMKLKTCNNIRFSLHQHVSHGTAGNAGNAGCRCRNRFPSSQYQPLSQQPSQ